MTVPNTKRVTRYLAVFLRWLLVLVSVFALSVYIGEYVINHVLLKVYSATAQVQVKAAPEVTHDAPASAVLVQAEVDFIQSPDLLLSVIKDLGLDKTWAKQDYPANSDQLPDVDALTHISRMLTLQHKNGTNLIDITIWGDDPNECATIANGVADHYKMTRGIPESSVRIISRAVPPTEPSRPRWKVDFVLTLVIAALAGLTTASFVEIIFLFVRAGERDES